MNLNRSTTWGGGGTLVISSFLGGYLGGGIGIFTMAILFSFLFLVLNYYGWGEKL